MDVGKNVGSIVGCSEGLLVDNGVGNVDGTLVGKVVGFIEFAAVGFNVSPNLVGN